MNLANEYAKRRGITDIVGTNESFLFLNAKNGDPSAICLISSHSRGLHACCHCGLRQDDLCLEILTPRTDGAINLIYHCHHPIELDITKQASSVITDPVPAKMLNNRDIDMWLWKIYFKNNANKSVWKEKTPIEQMVAICAENPKMFQWFYNFYNTIITGRTYLLYG